MTNPLLAKYEELYGKKEEPKKVPEDYKTKLAELRDTSTIPSVATSNTGIAAANPYISKLISYDPHSGNDTFLQISEKIKKGDAKVTSVTMNTENFTRSVTFEVQVFT